MVGLAEPTKVSIGSAADLIRKGGTLLSEACPRCGGVQIRYKGRTICLACGDLTEVSRVEAHPISDVLTGLRDLALTKMVEASNLLKRENDVEKQTNIVSLLLKYVELLDRVSRSLEAKK